MSSFRCSLVSGSLIEKDGEISQLQLQVELASKSSLDEVNETRLKIEESLRELEAHKAKRLAARNEMISLAKVCVTMNEMLWHFLDVLPPIAH